MSNAVVTWWRRLRPLFMFFVLLAGIGNFVQAGPHDHPLYAGTDETGNLAPGRLVRIEPIAMPAVYRASAWRMLYVTRDYAGRPIYSSGVAVISKVPPKLPGGQRIVAWAHPTVGTSRKCAPSASGKPTSYILGLNELVAAGHVVVATDYPGLGTQGPVGYLVGKGQAQAVLDAVRAARQISGLVASNEYAIYGYSQGAHAALFGALYASSYAPELKLMGVAAIAAPTDLAQLVLADADTAEGRILMSYALQSWSQKYGLPIRDVVADAALPTVAAINKRCVNTLAGKLDVFFAQDELHQPLLKVSPLALPDWRNVILSNSISVLAPGVPTLVLQGSQDSIVRSKVTLATVRSSCRAGGRIRYGVLEGSGHGGSAEAGKAQAIAWVNAALARAPLPTSCR
ncbi:MAG: lipase family protein [Proteobacteria bacterium]|nr:lipase family protein [Pseudomonadota bacterium]